MEVRHVLRRHGSRSTTASSPDGGERGPAMKRSSAKGLLYLVLLAIAVGCTPSKRTSPSLAAAPVVRVTHVWARPSPPMARMGAAYVTLASTVDDRLLEVRVRGSIAARAELHEVVTVARGQVTMRRVDGISL